MMEAHIYTHEGLGFKEEHQLSSSGALEMKFHLLSLKRQKFGGEK